jgi:chromosome segregation ATPase
MRRTWLYPLNLGVTRSERKRLEGKIERLRMQHTEAIRDKSVAANKSRNLLDKVKTLEKQNEDLGRRLNDKKDVAAEAKMEAESARAEAQAAYNRAVELELEVKSMSAYREKTESTTRAGVDRAHTLFVDAYRDLGAQTAPFDKSGGEVGTHFLGWLQEELESLPSIMTGLMS